MSAAHWIQRTHLFRADEFIGVSGKTSDLNPGMKANTLFSRSLFFYLLTISDRLHEHIVI